MFWLLHYCFEILLQSHYNNLDGASFTWSSVLSVCMLYFCSVVFYYFSLVELF